MTKKILFITFSIISFNFFSQNDSSEVKLDLLKAPSSPGFMLLNQQATDIERPTTPTDFAISLRNASTNFSAIPKNYAVEMAPAWLFGSKRIGYEKAFGESSHQNVFQNILQTLNLSLAYSSIDTAVIKGASQFGIGFKFSLIRGKINPEFTNQVKKINTINQIIGIDFHAAALEYLAKDSNYVQINRLFKQILHKPIKTESDSMLINSLPVTIEKIINYKKDQFAIEYKSSKEEERKKSLKTLAALDVVRSGLFLDVAVGTVLDFPTPVFEYSEINKYGAWITGGYDDKNWSLMALGRVLQNKKTPFLNDSNFVKISASTSLDFGVRVLYKKNKFNVSLEGISRSYLDSKNYVNGWKATFYLSYDLGNNKLVTLNISRDFNGTTTTKGNLLTALNLIIGLGSNRQIKN